MKKVNKVCVIGGSGFVGSRLLDVIKDKLVIKNFDKNSSKKFSSYTIIGDIRDKDSLNKELCGQELVVLLAAEHRDDVNPISLYYDVNVKGTENVLEAFDNNGVKRIIFTSSVAIYGLNKPNPSENHQANPFNHYGKSKWQAEKLLRDWVKKEKDRTLIIIRPTVIFGENNRGNVYNLLKQIASRNFLKVGTGNNKKSMAYVGNVAEFIKYQIENIKTGYEVFNYVDKPDFSMNELVLQVEQSLGIKVPSVKIPFILGMLAGYGFDGLSYFTKKKFAVNSVRIKKFCATTQFDATEAHTSGFNAPFTLSEGLDRTIKYEFKNKN
jgi:nucleoside-diphosphate-sugar epimerase